jgi:FMN phosphatase YigB (HAD superfamily)
MAKLNIRGIAFDMYGTVVDVGAVAEACQAIAPDAVAFNNQCRAKLLEYTFLRSTMGKYQDFAPKTMTLHKQHILFVSSNSFDVVGAKSFGSRVCWINRAGAPLDPLGPSPDVTVKNFDELGAAVS